MSPTQITSNSVDYRDIEPIENYHHNKRRSADDQQTRLVSVQEQGTTEMATATEMKGTVGKELADALTLTQIKRGNQSA